MRWQSLERVEVVDDAIILILKPQVRAKLNEVVAPDRASVEEGRARVIIPGSNRRWRGRSEITRPDLRPTLTGIRIDPVLIRAMSRAYMFVADVRREPTRSIAEVAAGRQTREPYFRRLMQLYFLAPDIQQAIMEGRQPRGLGLEQLMKKPIPLNWNEQRRVLGFCAS